MAYTLDGASYDSKTLTIGDSFAVGAAISSDGTKAFAAGRGRNLYMFPLSTPYDVSTAGAKTTVALSDTVVGPKIYGIKFSPDGLILIVGSNDYCTLFQYTLSTAFDITSATYSGKSLDYQATLAMYAAFDFSADGTLLILGKVGSAELYVYNLSTAWDISTASLSATLLTFSTTGALTALAFVSNGWSLMVESDAGNNITQYDMSTPYDLASATATAFAIAPIHTINGLSWGMCVSEAGGKLYMVGVYGGYLHQFSMVEVADPEPPVDPEPLPAVAESFLIAKLFRAVLTGTDDSTTDYTLPISKINARLRSAAASYLQVTLPYTTEIAQAISDRPNGVLYLHHVLVYSDGTESENAIVNVPVESIQVSKGVENRSIVLIGHRQSTNSTPASHDMRPLSTQTGDTTTIICPDFDVDIKPADTITGDELTLLIDVVSLQASAPATVITQYVGTLV